MNSIADDIKTLIEEQSELGLVFAQNLFISREPIEPHECVTIYDTAAGNSDLTLNRGINRMDTAQLKIRGRNYDTTMALAESLFTYFHGMNHFEIGETYYNLITASNPFVMEWDDNNRVKLVINLNCIRR